MITSLFKHTASGLALAVVLSQAVWAEPACTEPTPACQRLDGQMQAYYGIRPDNQFGRVVDFYRIDANRWRHAAKADRHLPTPPDNGVRGSSDRAGDFRRGQLYISLSETDKWRVLKARQPEQKLAEITPPETLAAIEHEAAFFKALPGDVLRIHYMTLTPAQRWEAVVLGDKAGPFIRAHAGEYTDGRAPEVGEGPKFWDDWLIDHGVDTDSQEFQTEFEAGCRGNDCRALEDKRDSQD